MNDSQDILKAAAAALRHPTPFLNSDELLIYVRSFLQRRDSFLNVCRQQGLPLYLFDEQALLTRARQFTDAFKKIFADVQVFYAVKSNNHPAVAKALVNFGMGLDVSSGKELELALQCGCRDIIFSGPGKTEAELYLAAENRAGVILLMDSFGELERLERVTRKLDCEVQAGLRLTSDETGLWRKFGIPLTSLESFMDHAYKCYRVNFAGLQFHTSWNHDSAPQVAFLARLGQTLKSLPPKHLAAIKFLDIGGGYWPSRGEWLQAAGTPSGRLRRAVSAEHRPATEHYKLDAQPIETFARQIGAAVSTHIFPTVKCRIHSEPGRWLCNDAMHILLSVVDKKADDLVVTDAGTNIIGWERFESDYAPVINLTRPSEVEHKCLILGSLCTPHDVWGYGYFGAGIEPGDILLIPGQGAYTYSLRQEFIKPLAKVVPL
jgi:diaminopimelate decarboxylase